MFTILAASNFLNYLKTNAKIGRIHLFYATARQAIAI